MVGKIAGGQVGPELGGAAAGRGDDGLEVRQGRGLIVVDHQVVIPVGFFEFRPAIGQAAGQFLGVEAPPALQAPLQFRQAGGQDEDQGPLGKFVFEGPGSPGIEIEDQVPPWRTISRTHSREVP